MNNEEILSLNSISLSNEIGLQIKDLRKSISKVLYYKIESKAFLKQLTIAQDGLYKRLFNIKRYIAFFRNTPIDFALFFDNLLNYVSEDDKNFINDLIVSFQLSDVTDDDKLMFLLFKNIFFLDYKLCSVIMYITLSPKQIIEFNNYVNGDLKLLVENKTNMLNKEIDLYTSAPKFFDKLLSN